MLVPAAVLLYALVPFAHDHGWVAYVGLVGSAGLALGSARAGLASVRPAMLVCVLTWAAAACRVPWPLSFVLPPVFVTAAARWVPALRARPMALRVGSFDRTTAAWTAATVLASSAALTAWLALAAPDLSNVRAMLPNVGWPWLLMGGLAFALFNAALEEGIYRVLFLDALLASGFSAIAAVVLQGVSFGLLHALGFPRGAVGIVLAGAWGMVLGGLRVRTRGLLAVYVTHVAADATIFALVLTWMQGHPVPVAHAEAAPVSASFAREGSRDEGAPLAQAAPSSASASSREPAYRELRLSWRPPRGPARAYAMDDPRDQHRLLLFGHPASGAALPVVVALHGQPRRGSVPRDYESLTIVAEEAERTWRAHSMAPFALALPVYRNEGGAPWPGFEPRDFLARLEELLGAEGLSIRASYWMGHSAAAGCSGGGLNEISGAKPAAVAFLDTCVGPGFQRAVRALRETRVPTFVVHSVETAGFSPHQAAEYMTTFDFGQVDAPLGLAPAPCPARLPDSPLRDQSFRCAASPDGLLRSFVIDTGSGEPGHMRALAVGARFFFGRVLLP